MNFIQLVRCYVLLKMFPSKSHAKSYTVQALVSDHLGNSEKWSQLELVAYENGLS